MMRQAGSAPVRVRLLRSAAAKSHRPEHLFASDTCPIIGAGGVGEIFVKGTPDGLQRLTGQIEGNTSKQITRELSVVDAIEPVTPAYRRQNIDPLDILRHSPKRGEAFITRVQLFDYGRDPAQAALVLDFETSCTEKRISIRHGGYSPSSFTYAAECKMQ